VVPISQIQSYVREVARQFKPKKVVLFGSHAYGTPGVDSDVDLLVIMTHSGRPPYQEAKIRTAVRAPFPVDLMVRTPGRLQRRLAMKDSFMTEIMHKGRVLHES
jgi:predicted nucleotidyltransferase